MLYFVASLLIRYIPTILASGLVLFLGIELTLEAAWESSKDLIWTEWLVVMATLLACTFLGFAPGVGVGLGAAIVVYTGWGCWDLVKLAWCHFKGGMPSLIPCPQRAKVGYVDRNLAILSQHSRRLQSNNLHRHGRLGASYTRLPDTSPEESGNAIEEKFHPQIRVVRLNGYVCECTCFPAKRRLMA